MIKKIFACKRNSKLLNIKMYLKLSRFKPNHNAKKYFGYTMGRHSIELFQ